MKLNEPGVKDRYHLEDLKEMKFDARLIVSKVIQLYLNLHSSREFREAVVTDERSFDASIFQVALQKISDRKVIPED